MTENVRNDVGRIFRNTVQIDMFIGVRVQGVKIGSVNVTISLLLF